MVVMVDPFTWGIESFKRHNANTARRKQKRAARKPPFSKS